jgi:hypothetical protein
MSSSPSYIADFDSATAMLRATSAYLRGEDFPALGQARLLELPVRLANRLPLALRKQAFIFSGRMEALPPKKIGQVSAEAISEWVVSEYPERRYPAVAIGSSNGAATHLYAALGIPWLPQTFLIPVRQPVHPDEPTEAMEIGVEPGTELLRNNPDIQLHHMHDANQDRLMVRAMTYYRTKRRRLGRAYRRFIEQNLPPGGTIFVLDCRLDWGVTTVGDRHWFQHGALGGATEDEFHHGGDRVEQYLAKEGSPYRRWHEPPVDTRMPEAEWGFEPSLMEEIEDLARQRHYRIRRIVIPDPAALSPFVADLYRWWNRARRIPGNRLVASSFVLMEPYWTLRTGSVPFWMVFNMESSRKAVLDYLDGSDPFDDIHLMLFSNGVPDAVGVTSGDDWNEVLDRARRRGVPAGVDLQRFPADFSVLARYHGAMKAIAARYPLPAPLTLEELDRFIVERGPEERVRWEELSVSGVT